MHQPSITASLNARRRPHCLNGPYTLNSKDIPSYAIIAKIAAAPA